MENCWDLRCCVQAERSVTTAPSSIQHSWSADYDGEWCIGAGRRHRAFYRIFDR